MWPSVLPGYLRRHFWGGKKVQNTFSNREKKLQRHGQKPERFCPSLHCLFIILSLWHIRTAVKWWRWFDCSRILFRGLSLLGISRGEEIQTLTLSLYMRIQRIQVRAAGLQPFSSNLGRGLWSLLSLTLYMVHCIPCRSICGAVLILL